MTLIIRNHEKRQRNKNKYKMEYFVFGCLPEVQYRAIIRFVSSPYSHVTGRGLSGNCDKKVTGLRDSHTRVIASKSIARTSISFRDLPLLNVMIRWSLNISLSNNSVFSGGHFVRVEPLFVICLSGFRCYLCVNCRVWHFCFFARFLLSRLIYIARYVLGSFKC